MKRTWLLSLTLFFSGAAALVYQLVWFRQLSLVMGSSLGAVATVLATFMAGLGLGSALAARWIDGLETRRLPKIYASLEAGIAASGLAFPIVIEVTTPLLRSLYTSSGSGLAVLRFVTAVVFLLFPTTLMGATLPTLTALRERLRGAQDGVAHSAALLYAANTFGAVVGSLAVGVFLFDWFGLQTTTFLAVLLNVLAGAIVWRVSTEDVEEAPAPTRASATKLETAGLVVIALSGFAALTSEVAWIRSIVLLIGPTTYGLSFIVSSVVFGIALGSAVASRWAMAAKAWWRLAAVQLAAAAFSIVLIRVIGELPIPVGELVRDNADDIGRLLRVELLWVAALLVPPSLLFGASFPLAVAVVAGQDPSSPPASVTGRTYLANTAGAVIGSLATGFLVIPVAGAEAALYLAAGVQLGASVWLVVRAPSLPKQGRVVAAFVLVVLALGIYRVLPRWDRELMSGGLYKVAPYLERGEFLDFLRRGELVFYDEDDTATVAVKRVGRRVSLAVDGKVDATNAEDMLTQRMLAHVPLLLHPAPSRVLVIGYGSGVTAGSALEHPVASVEAVEISKAVVAASQFFRDVNHDPPRDDRFTLYVTDGRNHLLLSDDPFDVIISEPSNPWMAGVSGLFTREFFALARDRLSADGLFCQWAHIYNMSEDDLKTVVGSFTDVFEHTMLFLLSDADVLLVGGHSVVELPPRDVLERRMKPEGIRNDLEDVGVRGYPDFASLFGAKTPALAAWARDAVRHTDDHPVLEFRAARAMHRETGLANRRAILALSGARPEGDDEALRRRGAMLQAAESFEWAFELYSQSNDYDGMVRTAIALGDPGRAERALTPLTSGSDAARAQAALGLLYRNAGALDHAVESLSVALQLEPDNRDTLLLAAEVAGAREEPQIMAAIARQILRVDPLDAEAAALLAEVSLRTGDSVLAASQARAILAQRPDATRALQVLAIADTTAGNRGAARRGFERLLELEPDAFIHLNNYARLELEAGNLERALELFERAVDLNPRNVVGYKGLAQSADLAGDNTRLERAQSMLDFLEAR